VDGVSISILFVVVGGSNSAEISGVCFVLAINFAASCRWRGWSKTPPPFIPVGRGAREINITGHLPACAGTDFSLGSTAAPARGTAPSRRTERRAGFPEKPGPGRLKTYSRYSERVVLGLSPPRKR